jgi:hypothetical protein
MFWKPGFHKVDYMLGLPLPDHFPKLCSKHPRVDALRGTTFLLIPLSPLLISSDKAKGILLYYHLLYWTLLTTCLEEHKHPWKVPSYMLGKQAPHQLYISLADSGSTLMPGYPLPTSTLHPGQWQQTLNLERALHRCQDLCCVPSETLILPSSERGASEAQGRMREWPKVIGIKLGSDCAEK